MADFMSMSRDQSKLAQALLGPTDLHSIIDKEVSYTVAANASVKAVY